MTNQEYYEINAADNDEDVTQLVEHVAEKVDGVTIKMKEGGSIKMTGGGSIKMTGDFIIRIGQGVTVQRGDLLMSAGDGTAKPQEDDIIRSKTIAKVTSTHVSCTYDDGSYCVPCVLMAC